MPHYKFNQPNADCVHDWVCAEPNGVLRIISEYNVTDLFNHNLLRIDIA